MPADLMTRPSGAETAVDAARPRVAVVINTYNHAHYLAQAIDSVLAQTHAADEIIVLDDGSTDQPDQVVQAYPQVRLVRQENQGLAAARNTGLAAATSEMIVFLDADDRLLPTALACGLRRHEEAPGSAFVYGGFRRIADDGSPIGQDQYRTVGEAPYLDFLRGNIIGMHATVMYRRDVLAHHGGFDATLRRCEDYELYLRLARAEKIASHPDIIAEYRWHGANMSRHHRTMLASTLGVLDRQAPVVRDNPAQRDALADGRRIWKRYYAGQAWAGRLARDDHRSRARRATDAAAAAISIAPAAGVFVMLSAIRSYARNHLPTPVVHFLKRVTGIGAPPFGRFNFGHFARTLPVSNEFGFDRGKPVDRYYVEAFLDRQKADIKGRTLEIGDDSYTRQFGGSAVQQADVLHVTADNPHATIVGDLSQPQTLPADAFDCLVLTQTLHLIFDLHAAVAAMHRALKPGGVVLLTVPGISQIDRGEWGSTWYWAITPAAAIRLFGDVFGPENVQVESHGNVYAATTFLQGLALEEVSRSKLDVVDPAYPVIVTVRAEKRG